MKYREVILTLILADLILCAVAEDVKSLRQNQVTSGQGLPGSQGTDVTVDEGKSKKPQRNYPLGFEEKKKKKGLKDELADPCKAGEFQR